MLSVGDRMNDEYGASSEMVAEEIVVLITNPTWPHLGVAKACSTPVDLEMLSLMSGVMPSAKVYDMSKD
jgi:hypothetical protein